MKIYLQQRGKNSNFHALPQQHTISAEPTKAARQSREFADVLILVAIGWIVWKNWIEFSTFFFFVYLHIGLNSFSLHTLDGKWENFNFSRLRRCCCRWKFFSLVIVRICDPHEGIQIFSYPILQRTLHTIQSQQLESMNGKENFHFSQWKVWFFAAANPLITRRTKRNLKIFQAFNAHILPGGSNFSPQLFFLFSWILIFPSADHIWIWIEVRNKRHLKIIFNENWVFVRRSMWFVVADVIRLNIEKSIYMLGCFSWR